MTHLKQRLIERNSTLLKKDLLNGAHAGEIYRIETLDEDERRSSFIYKEFAAGRNNEIDIYTKLKNYIESFSKVQAVWESSPQAILMDNMGSALKKEFNQSSLKKKKNYIDRILNRLSDLHSTRLVGMDNEIPTHQLTDEWHKWCLDQMDRLHSECDWFEGGWLHTINDAYKQLGISNYSVSSPLTLTHGDPHLENVFYQDDEIWLIDWEWAAVGSPLRDITILCQDLYDFELIQYVYDSYRGSLGEKGVNNPIDDYRKDFNYLYIDHTTMMLAWEIEKFFQGYTTQERIHEIINFKIGEIRRVIGEELR